MFIIERAYHGWRLRKCGADLEVKVRLTLCFKGFSAYHVEWSLKGFAKGCRGNQGGHLISEKIKRNNEGGDIIWAVTFSSSCTFCASFILFSALRARDNTLWYRCWCSWCILARIAAFYIVEISKSFVKASKSNFVKFGFQKLGEIPLSWDSIFRNFGDIASQNFGCVTQ